MLLQMVIIMSNHLQSHIDLFTHLYPDSLVVLDGSFEIIISPSYCDTVSFEKFIEILKSSKNDKELYKLKNGNIVKSLKLTIDDKLFYFVSVDRIDSNPDDYDDPVLRKVSFFLNHLPDGIAVLRNNEVIFRNHKIAKLLNIPKDIKDSEHYSSYIKAEGVERLQKIIKNKDKGSLVLQVVTHTGEEKWITTSLSKTILNNDTYHIVAVKDITEQKIQLEKHRAQKEYLDLTLKSINEGIIICDKNNKVTLFNNIATEISGITEEDALGKDILDLLIVIDEDETLVEWCQEEDFRNDNSLIVSESGLLTHVSLSVSSIIDDGSEMLGKAIILIDISEAKRKEKEILYLSYHDVLTGLFNRTFLEIEIKRLDTNRQLPFSIMMGDVNGLKLTNDVFGHNAGDNLLRKVAEVLKNACRQEDIIGRWGGDEFIILLPNTTEEEAYVVMRRIIREFADLGQRDSVNGLIPKISVGYGVKKKENEDIYDTLKVAESNMYKRKMLSKESMYSSVITSMKTSLFEKSNETEEHTNRLYNLCYKVGLRYKLSNDEFNDLELLCVLHDIGKIGISDMILRKPGKLNDEEWKEMKTHPEIGFRIAQATPELKKVSMYILGHHEKFDGTGYPKGLKKYEIPLLDRILSVADAYDAMTNDRTYRSALTKEEAIKELTDNCETQFDPDVVKIFLEEL